MAQAVTTGQTRSLRRAKYYGLQGRYPRQFGQALGAGQGDEFSYIGGVRAGGGGRGVEFAAQPALANGPGDDIAALDVVTHGPGRQRGDAAAAGDQLENS